MTSADSAAKGLVPFTRYMRPNGERQVGTIEVELPVEALAYQVMRQGYRFEVELLSTGVVHLDCCGPALDGSGEDAQIASELTPNDGSVISAAERLIRRAAGLLSGRK